jgi:hypothetical protein
LIDSIWAARRDRARDRAGGECKRSHAMISDFPFRISVARKHWRRLSGAISVLKLDRAGGLASWRDGETASETTATTTAGGRRGRETNHSDSVQPSRTRRDASLENSRVGPRCGPEFIADEKWPGRAARAPARPSADCHIRVAGLESRRLEARLGRRLADTGGAGAQVNQAIFLMDGRRRRSRQRRAAGHLQLIRLNSHLFARLVGAPGRRSWAEWPLAAKVERLNMRRDERTRRQLARRHKSAVGRARDRRPRSGPISRAAGESPRTRPARPQVICGEPLWTAAAGVFV